ncbi:hypothetical protein Taro_025305 [Colocasia esculenta]|uniref:Uncharacterized protein n=1 Tax=Colocasia esculenta TaxID=4460 RepID=A0A843VH75_COLES|nr:hypothetical protein [Colocasia esculenta]
MNLHDREVERERESRRRWSEEREMSAAAVPPSTSAGRHNVFVYGSLMAEEVVSVLLKRVPASSPAALHG